MFFSRITIFTCIFLVVSNFKFACLLNNNGNTKTNTDKVTTPNGDEKPPSLNARFFGLDKIIGTLFGSNGNNGNQDGYGSNNNRGVHPAILLQQPFDQQNGANWGSTFQQPPFGGFNNQGQGINQGNFGNPQSYDPEILSQRPFNRQNWNPSMQNGHLNRYPNQQFQNPQSGQSFNQGELENQQTNNQRQNRNQGLSFGNQGSELGNQGAFDNQGSSFVNQGSGLGNQGTTFGNQGSSFGKQGPGLGNQETSFDNQGSSFGSQGSGLGNQGTSFDNQGSSFGNQGSGLGYQGTSFDNQGSSFGNQGSGLGSAGSRFDNKGSSFGNQESGFGNQGSGFTNQAGMGNQRPGFENQGSSSGNQVSDGNRGFVNNQSNRNRGPIGNEDTGFVNQGTMFGNQQAGIGNQETGFGNQASGSIPNGWQNDNNFGVNTQNVDPDSLPNDLSFLNVTTQNGQVGTGLNGEGQVYDEEPAAIRGRPVIVPTVTTPAGQITFNNTAPETSAQVQCVQDCRTTSEYSPVCGSNNVTYFNPARFRCARQCGIHVFVQHQGRCERPRIG